ncbi:uncharacterized protein LOC141551355 [Sminthopsis crassicaudata]|uniref:uncharacterized protein LOC141551355 n=1 Tax=Sminthopsis crassicaudata TaxID=9301 RepID=UPI003D699186
MHGPTCSLMRDNTSRLIGMRPTSQLPNETSPEQGQGAWRRCQNHSRLSNPTSRTSFPARLYVVREHRCTRTERRHLPAPTRAPHCPQHVLSHAVREARNPRPPRILLDPPTPPPEANQLHPGRGRYGHLPLPSFRRAAIGPSRCRSHSSAPPPSRFSLLPGRLSRPLQIGGRAAYPQAGSRRGSTPGANGSGAQAGGRRGRGATHPRSHLRRGQDGGAGGGPSVRRSRGHSPGSAHPPRRPGLAAATLPLGPGPARLRAGGRGLGGNEQQPPSPPDQARAGPLCKAAAAAARPPVRPPAPWQRSSD